MMRTDTEILKDLIDAVMEYNSLRDEEWDFNDRNGNPCMWDEDACAEHDELLADITKSRHAVRDLIVEATGDTEISF